MVSTMLPRLLVSVTTGAQKDEEGDEEEHGHRSQTSPQHHLHLHLPAAQGASCRSHGGSWGDQQVGSVLHRRSHGSRGLPSLEKWLSRKVFLRSAMCSVQGLLFRDSLFLLGQFPALKLCSTVEIREGFGMFGSQEAEVFWGFSALRSAATPPHAARLARGDRCSWRRTRLVLVASAPPCRGRCTFPGAPGGRRDSDCTGDPSKRLRGRQPLRAVLGAPGACLQL